MAAFVDISEIEAVLARATLAMEPKTKLPGSHGAQARMALAVEHAFGRQMAAEINLDTSSEHLSDALAAACCNMIFNLVDGIVSSGDPAERVAMLNNQMIKTAEFMMQRLTGKASNVSNDSVPVREAIRA